MNSNNPFESNQENIEKNIYLKDGQDVKGRSRNGSFRQVSQVVRLSNLNNEERKRVVKEQQEHIEQYYCSKHGTSHKKQKRKSIIRTDDVVRELVEEFNQENKVSAE